MEEKNKAVRENIDIYEEDEIDLYELWLTLKKRKKVIIGLFLVITFSTALISLLMTPVYRSEASVIPVSASSSPLGELAGLAAMAGFSVGGETDTAKIKAVLKSRTIKEEVIKDLNLIPVLLEDDIPEDRDPMNVAVETLDEMVSISEDKKTGVITISVDYKDPEIAKKIGGVFIEKLQKIMNEKALTLAKVNRIFLEKQLKEEEKRLKDLQKKLADFQKKTKIIQPSEQLAGIMELYSDLISKKIELTVRLRSMESAFSVDNPQIKAVKEQLQAISQQIKDLEEKTNIGALPSLGKAPEKLLEYADLMRQIKISETIYGTLIKMYEQAKLEEAKNNIYVEIIDPPSLPDKPIKPKKKLMVAVAGVSSLFLGIFLAFFLEWLENIRKRREELS